MRISKFNIAVGIIAALMLLWETINGYTSSDMGTKLHNSVKSMVILLCAIMLILVRGFVVRKE